MRGVTPAIPSRAPSIIGTVILPYVQCEGDSGAADVTLGSGLGGIASTTALNTHPYYTHTL